MAINSATLPSTPHSLSTLIEAAYMLSILLLTMRGVQYPVVGAAAATVTPGNGPAPITANYNPELCGGVTTPDKNFRHNANLRSICTALCRAGLGGLPCERYRCSVLFNTNVKNTDVGDDVNSHRKHTSEQHRPHKDNAARPLTIGGPSSAVVKNLPSIATPRRKVCTKLCDYNLGSPLCECDPVQRVRYPPMDSECICAIFCWGYKYQLDGCPACVDDVLEKSELTDLSEEEHKEAYKKNGPMVCSLDSTSTSASRSGPSPASRRQIDWNQWCINRCSEGDGGAACNCDILPFSSPV